MALKKMKYKTFTWVNNPYECKWDCDRAFADHKYPEYNGSDLEDFGPNAITISGSGEFFGKNAYKNWYKLAKVFNSHEPGLVYNPIYKDVTYGLMTKLSSSVESRENYVSYTFEIVAGRKATKTAVVAIGTKMATPQYSGTDNPSTVKSTTSTTSSSKNTSETSGFKMGDIVVANGLGYVRPDRSVQYPYSKLFDHVKTTITNIYTTGDHDYPIHVGAKEVGWMPASCVKLYVQKKPTYSIYVVKFGDTFTTLSMKFGMANWKEIAEDNKIKNIGAIYPGQKLMIAKENY